MNEILGGVSGMMPKMLDQELPEMTSPALPLPTTKLPKF